MGEVKIYGLCCPKTKEIKYIGATYRNLDVRFHEHIRYYKLNKTKKDAWIGNLQKEGLIPLISVLEVANFETWQEVESKWIATGLENGWNLLNERKGGQGFKGYLLKDKYESKHSARISPELEDKVNAYILKNNVTFSYVVRMAMMVFFIEVGVSKGFYIG